MFPEIQRLEHLLGTPFLETVLESSQTCIILAEAPSGKILYINDAVRKFRGKTDAPLTGIALEQYVLSWKDYHPDGTLMKSEEMPLARAILGGETIENQEVIVELDNGEYRWALASACPIKDNQSEIVAGIVSWSDITEYKKNQASLKEAQEEIRILRGILPLCSFCKKIRDRDGHWEQIEVYLSKNSQADISHGICSDCLEAHYPEEYDWIQSDTD